MKKVCFIIKRYITKIKCNDFTESDRLNIFKRFWKMSWKEKKVFVIENSMLSNKKRMRQNNTDVPSRRSHSLMYYLH